MAAIQFIRHENGWATVLVVPTHTFDQQVAYSLLGQFQDKLGGEMKFSIKRVGELQKTPAGKTPWVINRGTSFHE